MDIRNFFTAPKASATVKKEPTPGNRAKSPGSLKKSSHEENQKDQVQLTKSKYFSGNTQKDHSSPGKIVKPPKAESQNSNDKNESKRTKRSKNKRIELLSDDEDDIHVISEDRKDQKSASEQPRSISGKRKREEQQSTPVKKSAATPSQVAPNSDQQVADSSEQMASSSQPEPTPKKFVPKWAQSSDPPPMAGQIDLPSGKDGCLAGKTFVMTGVLRSLERDEAKDLIVRYGGRVTGSVSSKTTYLVKEENSEETSKVKKAKSLGTKIITEEQLFSIISESLPPSQRQPKSTVMKAEDVEAREQAAVKSAPSPAESNAQGTSLSKPERKPEKQSIKKSLSEQALELLAKPKLPSSANRSKGSVGSQLWTDKWRPKKIGDIVGNKSGVKQLENWLQQWTANWYREQAASRSSDGKKAKGKAGNSQFPRSVLVSGPPGIGKTSSVNAIALSQGFEVVEFNASDVRNKKAIHEHIASICLNRGLTADGKSLRKLAIIMDEVDGMSGSDRGGVAELISVIRKTAVPIFCVCNDAWSQKLRSLRNVCMEVKFLLPRPNECRARLVHIARSEGFNFSTESEPLFDHLMQVSMGDMRFAINNLQSIRTKTDSLSWNAVTDLGSKKEQTQASLFDIVSGALLDGRRRLPFSERSEAYFRDYSMVPLFVQENYIRTVPAAGEGNIAMQERFARSAEALSLMDVFSNKRMASQSWDLLPFESALTVEAGFHIRGAPPSFARHPTDFTRIQFPALLSKLSNINKHIRQAADLYSLLSLHSSSSKSDLGFVLSCLGRLITKKLQGVDQTGSIEDAVQIMHDYGLTKTDFDVMIGAGTGTDPGLSWPLPNAEKSYSKVETKRKTAFTRACNALHVAFAKGKAAGGRSSAKQEGILDPEGAIDEAVEEDDVSDEDKEEDDSMFTKGKGSGSKRSARSTSTKVSKKARA